MFFFFLGTKEASTASDVCSNPYVESAKWYFKNMSENIEY